MGTVINYWTTGLKGYLRKAVAFIDVEDCFAEKVLHNHGVHYRFMVRGLGNPENEMIFRQISIPFWEVSAMQSAMEELCKKILLSGHPRYLNVCAKLHERLVSSTAEEFGVACNAVHRDKNGEFYAVKRNYPWL